jgi:hypothetical protein
MPGSLVVKSYCIVDYGRRLKGPNRPSAVRGRWGCAVNTLYTKDRGIDQRPQGQAQPPQQQSPTPSKLPASWCGWNHRSFQGS